MGKKLIRTMKGEVVNGFKRPTLGNNISRVLGVRYCQLTDQEPGRQYDIVTDENGIIINVLQGLSVSPPPKENMPEHLLRLKSGENYFYIDETVIAKSQYLVYIEDSVPHGVVARHGIIAPRYQMHINDYISYLSATREFWEVLYDEVTDETNAQTALRRQLNAEFKSVHFRIDK